MAGMAWAREWPCGRRARLTACAAPRPLGNPFFGALGEEAGKKLLPGLKFDYVMAVEPNKTGVLFVLCRVDAAARELLVVRWWNVTAVEYRTAVGRTRGRTHDIISQSFCDSVAREGLGMVPRQCTLLTVIGGAVLGGFKGARGGGEFPVVKLCKLVGEAAAIDGGGRGARARVLPPRSQHNGPRWRCG